MLKMLIIVLLVFSVLLFHKKKERIIVALFALLIFPSDILAVSDATIQKYLPIYQDAMKKYGAPASFMIKIGIIETSLGTDPGAVTLNRGLNMHAIGYHTGCYVAMSNGRKWQKYSSEKDSIYDVARLLTKFDGPYHSIDCLNTSNYPTRDDMIVCLAERIVKYAPPEDGNDTEAYKAEAIQFMKSHPEYDEGLPSYEDAIRLRSDTESLPVISYGNEDESCKDNYDYSKEGAYDPNRKDDYGTIKVNYLTSYTGDIKKGYINLNQKDNALIYPGDEPDDLIKNKVFNIINNIFKKAGEYNDTSKLKSGASAYIANVSYLNGTFKNKVVYHNQGDYPSSPYGTYGTIKSHGCGPTSMAIVISSFKGETISPVTTTNWACSHGYCSSNGSYHSLICALANEYGLNCSGEIDSQSGEGQQRVINALASGNSLVVVLAGPGYFTNGGHFFVVTGIDANGNITVADPGSRNRTSKPYTFNKLVNPTQGHARKFWIISG